MLSFIKQNYNQNNFLEFIQSKIPSFEKNYEVMVDLENHKNIKKSSFLGSVDLDDGELGLFEFELTDNTDIENNRVSISNILKNKIKDNILNGAIAVFHNANKSVWRLSFIKIDYDEKLQEFATPPTRASFILGENVPLKTVTEQLAKITNSIESINSAFSVEPVSKKFFIEYKALYKTLCKDISTYLTNHNFEDKDTISFFVKKLLGRIVFLFFLQKKGWLGATDNTWTDGDRRFLVNLFEKYKDNLKTTPSCSASHPFKEGELPNFYNDLLAPMFFDALNTDRRKSEKPDYFDKLDCKIPYLNGGLFTRDERDIELEKNSIKIDDELFEKIFDLFSSYNFTIIEDSPEDVDIAIDPEMLGKVFEDLLEDRKEKGAFYTPREIVHYMCQQSLINYLKSKFTTEEDEQDIKDLVLHKKTDDNNLVNKRAREIKQALQEIKVLDPAIGSGAFPMGMLHEIVSALHSIDKYTNIAALKKQVIQNSIYGVDIEESAVEIAKLRFWLSIVVDSDTPEPLPNLFYKIMVGNSLLETINGFDPIQDVHANNNDLRRILSDIKDYFDCNDNTKKSAIKDNIQNNVIKLIREKATNRFGKDILQEKLYFDDKVLSKKEQKERNELLATQKLVQKVIGDLQNKSPSTELFLYKIYFADVLDNGGFDVVIANPPYVRQEKIKDLKAKQEIQDFKSYAGTADLYIYFFEKGYDLLKSSGVLTYITSNKWTRAKYGAKFRKFTLENTQLLDYIDFNGVKVFDSATVDTSVMILRKSQIKDTEFQYCLVDSTYNKNANLDKYINQNNSYIPQADMGAENFVFLGKEEQAIKKKIEKIGTPLKDWNMNIYRGLQTGNNDVFVIEKSIKDELIKQNPNSSDLIKPIVQGKHLDKYNFKYKDKYLIYVNDETDMGTYTAIYQYLLENKTSLSDKVEVREGKMLWYSLYRPAKKHIYEFEKEKISWGDNPQNSSFCLLPKSYYVLAPAYILTCENYTKYLLSILNTKLSFYYLQSISPSLQGHAISLKLQFLEQLPIPKFDKENHSIFEQKADEIIQAKERGLDTSKLEQEVDQMVYKLYELTDDEIAIIEKSVG
ncbi:Eco57I restriction-modification methylase domain-containing protein [Francisellaceae bacterium CB300]